MDTMSGAPRVRARRRVRAVLSAALAAAMLPVVASAQEPPRGAEACPVTAPQAGYPDRDEISPAHRHNVDCAAALGIIAGSADSRYLPLGPVRRDQMASLLARTLDAAAIELPPAEEGTDFSDVSADNPHRDSIRRLAAAGILAGGPLGRPAEEFGPGLPTRRDQMASLLDRTAGMAFLGLPGGSTAPASWAGASVWFRDVATTSVHATHIDQAADVGLVNGFPDGTFRPAAMTRRDHMASFVVRLAVFLAVPVQVELTEVPGPTVGVGQPVTVVATVSDQFGAPVIPERCATEEQELRFFNSRLCTVSFQVPGATPAEGLVEPDQSGRALFTFSVADAGLITITAVIRGPGGLYRAAGGDSDSVQRVAASGP